MTLNFPDSPSTGDTYTDSTSGFSYEWNGTVWISTDPQRAANIKELDDISSGFNGSTTQFNLTVSSSTVEPVSDSQLLISVGGVMQNPTNDYTVSGSTITFTTAPSAGLTFFGTFLGQALSLNTVQDGTVEFASFKTGTAGVGIKSDGTAIGVGITQIDFVGSGNTVVSVGNTVSVYIAAGIDTTGTSKFNNITATGDLNVTGNLTYEGVTATNQKIAGVTTTGGLNVLGITSTKDLISVGVATLTNGSATNFTVGVATITTGSATNFTATTLTATNFNTTHTTVSGVSTFGGTVDINGAIDADGGANFAGGETVLSSATVSDLTDNRVVIAGTSGALEDSSNLTFDGSTLTVNGDVSVAGTITYQEVSEIDAVGFVTARKGVRVTNGGIIVTAGLSTFSDDVKFAGANYDITYDRSANNIIWNDNAKGIFGTGNDLQLYHNGSNSKIYNATGRLDIEGDEIQFWNKAGNELLMAMAGDGGVSLRYDNTERFRTKGDGINVTGNIDCDSLNVAGISTFSGATPASFEHSSTCTVNIEAGSSNSAVLAFGDSGDIDIGRLYYYNANNSMHFTTNANDRMVLDSSGRLIISSNGTGTNQNSFGTLLQAAADLSLIHI